MANKAINELLKYSRMKFNFTQPNMTGDVTTGGATWGMSSTAWRGATWTASDGVGFVYGDCLRGNSGWQIVMYNPFGIYLGGFNYTNGYGDAILTDITLEVSNNGSSWISQSITKTIVGGAGTTWSGTINSAEAFKWLRWSISAIASCDCAELRLTDAYYYK